jgi:hypothetical protein
MEKRLTLTAAALTLAMIGLLPVLAMIANTFFGQGGFSLAAYDTLLRSGKEPVPLIGHSLLLSVFVTFFAIVLLLALARPPGGLSPPAVVRRPANAGASLSKLRSSTLRGWSREN